MIQMNKIIRHIQNAVIGILVLLILAFIGFTVIIQKNQVDLKNKEIRISNLIDEVGELKDQNRKMGEDMQSKNLLMKTINYRLNKLDTDLSAIDLKNRTEQAQMQSQAQQIQEDNVKLSRHINENEIKIASLAEKNAQLKKEVTMAVSLGETKNFLILGQNRKLTDTIIIANVDEKKSKITLIGIPRDFYYKGRKINELYEFYGIEKLKEAIFAITGLPIEKYVIFDFKSFTDLVDAIGGVDIDIPKSITDNAYPGPDNSYIVVSFEKGNQHLDGDMALKYARSRKSTTDFDRSKRQQLIVEAITKKMAKMDLLRQLDISVNMYNSLLPNLITDINLFEAMGYYGSYKVFDIITGISLTTQNYLNSTHNEKGQYILLPKAEGYSEIKEYILNSIR